MVERNIVVAPETRLTNAPERQVSVNLPGPINERLDRLRELADEEGARTSRKEIVAALILDAPEGGEDLSAAVIRYRKARARDAAIAGVDAADVLEFRRHSPGPRRRAGQG